MISRRLLPVVLAFCLLLAGCVGFGADSSTPTPDAPTDGTPTDRFDLRASNERAETVAARAWFVTGSLEGVVVTDVNGTNVTYDVDDLGDTPVAVNATGVSPLGTVGGPAGILLSWATGGVVSVDAADVERVVYAVSTIEEGTTPDAGGAVGAGDERLAFVGTAACSSGTVAGLSLTVGETASVEVTCE